MYVDYSLDQILRSVLGTSVFLSEPSKQQIGSSISSARDSLSSSNKIIILKFIGKSDIKQEVDFFGMLSIFL